MNFHELDREAFLALKKQYVHPSKEVSQPDQLVGREHALRLVQHAFERDGNNVFIWGRRGVGKTSLAHSAISKFSDLVVAGPVVALERNTDSLGLFRDIAYRAKKLKKSIVSNFTLKAKFEAFGLTLETGHSPNTQKADAVTVNLASEMLAEIFEPTHVSGRKTAIIIDEFDQLENGETVDFLTALAKQLSVDSCPVTFVFCGVSTDLPDLTGR